MENILTEFNEGGTHAQNPIGGIPQGMAPDGTPNSVEEGETKLTVGNEKYVFSDRINTKQSYIDAYSLPSYIIGHSFAEASKKIAKKFKDRTDNASMSTQIQLLNRLQEAHEMAKLEEEAKSLDLTVPELLQTKADAQANAQIEAEQQAANEQIAADQEASDTSIPPQGEVPQEGAHTEQFASGGDLAGGAVAGATGFAGSMVADLGQAEDAEVRDKMNVGGTAAKYGLMGAAAGSVVPGIGTAIGAGVGAAAGATMAIASNSKIAGEQQTFDFKQQGKKLMQNGYAAAYGGKQNQMRRGGPEPLWGEGLTFDTGQSSPYRNNPTGYSLYNPKKGATNAYTTDDGIGNEFMLPESDLNLGFSPEDLTAMNDASDRREALRDEVSKLSTDQEYENNPDNFSKENDLGQQITGYGSMAASLAPFVGNLVEGANLEQEDPIRYGRVGRTYRPEFADERGYINAVNESYAGLEGSIANATAGDRGAYRANLLGANINKSRAYMDAYQGMSDINRGERKLLNEDMGIATRENVALSNREKLEYKQDKAAFEDAKRSYRTAAYEGLGDIGESIFGVNQMEDMSLYDITGKRKKTAE